MFLILMAVFLIASQNWVQEQELSSTNINNQYHFTHLKDPF